MRGFLRSILIVARYELADAIRTRRVIVLLILYLAGAMLACNGFITVLHKLEAQLVESLSLSPTSSAGAVTEALWKSTPFRRMITRLVGSKQVALGMIYMLLGFSVFSKRDL